MHDEAVSEFEKSGPPALLPTPAIFHRRSVAAWVVIGTFVVFVILTLGLFFETVSPVADFGFQPYVEADSNAYWELSGVKAGTFIPEKSDSDSGSQFAGGSWGPVYQAKLFRTDLGVLLSNFAMLALILWVVSTMKEFDLSTFTLLLLLNPLLFSVAATLNKEIFSITGLILFLRYMTAERHRFLLLTAAMLVSSGGHWQQAAVLLLLVCLESRFSPFRNKPLASVIFILLFFTVAYTVVFHLVPIVIAGLLAQAEAGHTIVILDNIQGNFGFPLVVIPKILMNVMGHLSTPSYFLQAYWSADFSNWYDQIFMQVQEFLTTALLLGMLIARKLPLKQPLVYLLVVYLILTAVNPMVQPRYEYPAYVLLCLQVARYFRLGGRMSEATQSEGSLTAHAAQSLT
jgi:hypothetical protein